MLGHGANIILPEALLGMSEEYKEPNLICINGAIY
jgi:hypothetical protein